MAGSHEFSNRCRPRYLTMVQNYEVCRQTGSDSSCTEVTIASSFSIGNPHSSASHAIQVFLHLHRILEILESIGQSRYSPPCGHH
ncbi:hypothetical protein TNCV_4761871 [Trichonephila clavipes]|nr:hypothetical protein TNCV_4761871 [Trichonephila clavipes]